MPTPAKSWSVWARYPGACLSFTIPTGRFPRVHWHLGTSFTLCMLSPVRIVTWLVFPTRVLPIRNPGFLAIFYYPKSVFNYQTGVFKKNWNCCCIQILVILITLKLQIGACNGQISTCQLSTIIMRHEVRVLLGDHRTFVVGSFVFSFNWPI